MNSGFYYGHGNNLASNEAAPYIHTLELEKLNHPSELNRGLKQSMLFLMPKGYDGNVFYREGPIKVKFLSKSIDKTAQE